MLQYPLGLLRLFSLLDGLSWVVLSYLSFIHNKLLGNDLSVSIPGRIHGGIFVIFLVLLYLTMVNRKWPIKRAALVFICSLIPFAPFWLESKLKAEQDGMDIKN